LGRTRTSTGAVGLSYVKKTPHAERVTLASNAKSQLVSERAHNLKVGDVIHGLFVTYHADYQIESIDRKAGTWLEVCFVGGSKHTFRMEEMVKVYR
jgi:hypothetical protein